MQMIEDEEIGQVQITDSQILFTDKDETTVYKTGVMDDPNLTERLYASGATFTKEIEQTSSTFLNLLLSFGVPILIFIVIGQYLNKRLTNQAGGKNALQFGSMGKSSAMRNRSGFGWLEFVLGILMILHPFRTAYVVSILIGIHLILTGANCIVIALGKNGLKS